MPFPPDPSDPMAPFALPVLQQNGVSPPTLPSAWTGVALLHPFSPPPSDQPQPDVPFYQLCVANIAFKSGEYLSAQIQGCEYGTWWYWISPVSTFLSTDQGASWNVVDMGWTLPTTDWFAGSTPSYAGTSPLNWMGAQNVDWWKIPVPIGGGLNAATWMWFDSSSGFPVRLMFGQGPPSPTMGDPNQLGLLQMFSFTYFPVFVAQEATLPIAWETPAFDGFSAGNPENFELFTWSGDFGMTVFMTPVNEEFNPLPTRVLYQWKDDADYQVYSDRAQDTLMWNTYNTGTQPTVAAQEALLTGPAPRGVPPPPNSGTSFLITWPPPPGAPTCVGPQQGFGFPQEPPTWVQIPGVQGTIQATIVNNPVLCPGQTVTVLSVLFPPAPPNYPEATYLWTWYAPVLPGTGASSRPVTFMQSQSGVNVGTSLALADYFDYEEFNSPIDPANFAIPSQCSSSATDAADRGTSRSAAIVGRGVPKIASG